MESRLNRTLRSETLRRIFVAVSCVVALAWSVTVQGGEPATSAGVVSPALTSRARETVSPHFSLEVEPGVLTAWGEDGQMVERTSLPCVLDRPDVEGALRISVASEHGVERLALVSSLASCDDNATGYVMSDQSIGLCPTLCESRRHDPSARVIVEVFGPR